MISIISAPKAMPIAVPTGPAIGKKVVPGITNAPQPTLQPNDSAQTPSGYRYFFKDVLLAVMVDYTPFRLRFFPQ